MKVKLARIQSGLTQVQLRQKIKKEYDLGLSPNTLVEIERGNYDNLKLSTLKKIAAALNSTVQDLFFE